VAELIVVGFKKDMYRASEVLNDLTELNDDWVVDLHDAVAVYRDYSGKLRVDQSYQMTTGEGAGWGALWGLMIGSILAIPFTAGVSAAAAAHLAPIVVGQRPILLITCKPKVGGEHGHINHGVRIRRRNISQVRHVCHQRCLGNRRIILLRYSGRVLPRRDK
jgi:hypothetical protein